jgi:hypothetical protein
MRAGASSSAQRLSVEMDEYVAAYITMLTSRICSEIASVIHQKLLFRVSRLNLRVGASYSVTYESVILPFAPPLFSTYWLSNAFGWSTVVAFSSICPHLDFVSIQVNH